MSLKILDEVRAFHSCKRVVAIAFYHDSPCTSGRSNKTQKMHESKGKGQTIDQLCGLRVRYLMLSADGCGVIFKSFHFYLA